MKAENSSPYFSLVVPTYNRATLIEKTLKTLKDQTFTDFEVIVIDDGGSDDTKEVVESINDPRFTYVWKQNEERAVARNTGAGMANGQYINFFDSDDLAYPNHLQEAFDFIELKDSPEVFHLAYDFKSPEGEELRKVNNLPSTVNQILLDGNTLSCNGVFLRKDIALKYQFVPDRDLSATEDYVLWLMLAARFDFHNQNVITSSVIDHESRSVIRINKEKLILRKQLSIKYLSEDQVFMDRYAGYLKKIEADTYTYIALHLAIAKYSKSDSMSYLMKSIKARPTSILERRFWGTIKTMILK